MIRSFSRDHIVLDRLSRFLNRTISTHTILTKTVIISVLPEKNAVYTDCVFPVLELDLVAHDRECLRGHEAAFVFDAFLVDSRTKELVLVESAE